LINSHGLLINAGANRSDDQSYQPYHVCRERPSKNCVTCIVFVIQPVGTAQLIMNRHQSSPITFFKKNKKWLIVTFCSGSYRRAQTFKISNVKGLSLILNLNCLGWLKIEIVKTLSKYQVWPQITMYMWEVLNVCACQ
jgi:hypothetical protein